jgi:hypothetical protein
VAKVGTKVKDFEWNDWIQAMLKVATGYMDAGQKDLGRQVVNLLHGALVTSASYYRHSVMEACEHVRRTSTSIDCKWSAQSFFQADCHVLLNPIVGKSRETVGKRRRFEADGWRPSFQRGGVTADKGRSGHALDVSESPVGPKRQRPNVCRMWFAGKVCTFTPCRFLHKCASCGPVAVHDVAACSIAAVSSRAPQRT